MCCFFPRMVFLALAATAVAVAADFPSAGMLVDLDARKGVAMDEKGRVTSWKNQVGGENTRDFVGQPKGRPDATSGLPTVEKDSPGCDHLPPAGITLP